MYKISSRAARLNCGMNQQEVADKIGVNISTVSSWETGKTKPSLTNFKKLCELYAFPADMIKI